MGSVCKPVIEFIDKLTAMLNGTHESERLCVCVCVCVWLHDWTKKLHIWLDIVHLYPVCIMFLGQSSN